MEVEVRRVVSSDVGFVALPLHLIYLLQEGSSASGLPPLVVLELTPAGRREDGALVPWFVAWAGSSSNSSSIEVPERLGECIGLRNGIRVNVKVRIDIAEAESVHVVPASEDDCEILELNADYLENHVLSKVGVVQEGCCFPVSLQGQGVIELLAKSVKPKAVGKLVPGTELIVELKKRPVKVNDTDKKFPTIWLRVQEMELSLCQSCKLGTQNITVVPTTVVYLSQLTAENLSLQNGQLVVLESSTIGEFKSSGRFKEEKQEDFLGREKKTSDEISRRKATVWVVYYDGVARGHVMISRPLRHYIGAKLHAGVCIQACQESEMQTASNARISPAVFLPVQDSVSEDGSRNWYRKQHDVSYSDQHFKRHREIIAEESETCEAATLLKAWIESQEAACINAVEKPYFAISEGAPMSFRCDQNGNSKRQQSEITFILTLGNDTQEEKKKSCFILEKKLLLDSEVKSDKTAKKQLEVELLQPQYVRISSSVADEKELPPLEPLWLREKAVDAAARLKVLTSPVIRRKLRELGLPTPGGVLLHGPPACGKTRLALTLARELKEDKEILAHWIYLKCTELVGEQDKLIKRRFKESLIEAVERAPSVVIFDDLDALMPASESGGTSTETSVSVVAEFLSDLMDTIQTTAAVAFVATASGPTSVPVPLRTSGRFDYYIELVSPGIIERGQLLQQSISARNLICSDNVTNTIATKCDGFDSNDLEILIDRTMHVAAARLLSHSGDSKFELTADDFNTAIDGFVPASIRGVSKSSVGGSKAGWEDIGGLHEVRRVIRELLELPVKYPKIFAKAPLRLRTGVLLYGPPGCGKTYIVGAAASACSIRFISVKGPELLNKYIGASEQAVRDVFEKAAAAAPCILFFDEFESIAPKRGHDNTGVTDRVVNQFLAELDGVSALNGVFVFAATSRPDLIDAALLRPGRLDHLLFCNFPTVNERVEILRVLSKDLTLAEDVDLQHLAECTENYSGADLRGVLTDAQLTAVHSTLDTWKLVGVEECEKGCDDKAAAAAAAPTAATTAATVVTMDMLKKSLSQAAPLSHVKRREFMRIYDTFTSGKASNQDRKGKKATLA